MTVPLSRRPAVAPADANFTLAADDPGGPVLAR